MRAMSVLTAGSWDAAREVGVVLLDFDLRHRRRIVLRTEAGAELLLDLSEAVRLREGDGLALDQGGGVVRVRARPEPLLEIQANPPGALVRIAWHLGNRHLPVQVMADRLRVREDRVIAEMVEHLGGRVARLAAPFDPEAGAYSGGNHHHHPDDDRHGH